MVETSLEELIVTVIVIFIIAALCGVSAGIIVKCYGWILAL